MFQNNEASDHHLHLLFNCHAILPFLLLGIRLLRFPEPSRYRGTPLFLVSSYCSKPGITFPRISLLPGISYASGSAVIGGGRGGGGVGVVAVVGG